MRGGLHLQLEFAVRTGIIPADAGSTQEFPFIVLNIKDHPRGCGEHEPKPARQKIDPGSSPRMRGAHDPAGRPGQRLGIIPADAGSTNALNAANSLNENHPRGCGEHYCHSVIVGTPMGSSPRMRGAQPETVKLPMVIGIIPADAGSTITKAFRFDPDGDHPRGCGEHP